jgi:geranylgeranyl transferase type-1 subunit beta
MTTFEKEKHLNYFLKHIELMPTPYSGQDTNRLTILYFCVCACDTMNAIDKIKNKKDIIDWIYSLQIEDEENPANSGFIGGTFLGEKKTKFHKSHITMSYTALATLKILGDDYGRVNKKLILAGMKVLQKNGCFEATNGGGDTDMRFTYCACAVSYLLGDWSGMDKDLTYKYIIRSVRYDNSFPHEIGLEGHGGYTYCALSALLLMDRLEIDKFDALREWLLFRQEVGGLNGRPHKDADTCYSFWCGASLAILKSIDYLNTEKSIEFTLNCQSKYGGICKCQGVHPDPLHSFLSISGLSLMGFSEFLPIFPALGMTKRSLGME